MQTEQRTVERTCQGCGQKWTVSWPQGELVGPGPILREEIRIGWRYFCDRLCFRDWLLKESAR